MSARARPCGNLPDLLEEVEIRVGKRRVEALLMSEIQNLQQLRDKMMDEAVSMKLIDAACEIQEILDHALGFPERRRSVRTSAMCVAVINSWGVIKAENPAKKMTKLLIDMVDTDLVTKLGLIGEFA